METKIKELKSGNSRQKRRTDATKQKLLGAARALFAEKGLDLTTIDDITGRADVGKGTFYYHFRTKEQLIRSLMRSNLAELEAAITRKCSPITNLNQLLDDMIQVQIDFFSDRWEDFVLYFQGRADLILNEGYEGIDTPFIDYLCTIENLLDSVIKYHLSKATLRRIACAVTGFISGYYSFSSISTDVDDVGETFRGVRGALVASLARFIKEAVPTGY